MTIEKGMRIYLYNGQEAIYEMPVGERHVVCEIFEHGEGEEPSEPKVVDKVFLSPPTQKLANEIIELRKQSIALRAEARTLRDEIELAKRDRKAVLDLISQQKGLERIAEFISGRITHAMTIDCHGIWVQTIKDALVVRSEYDRNPGVKLITLYGESGGNLQFRINQYSDGSGSSKEIFLFTCEADANDALRALIESQWAEYRSGKIKAWNLDSPIKIAKSAGIEIPEDIHSASLDYLRSAKGEAVKKAQAELQEAITALQALEAKAVQS